MIWSSAFWRGAMERGVKTFAQSLVAVIGVGAVGLLDVDWLGALSAATLATVVSLLTSIGNADFTAGQTPVIPEQIADLTARYLDDGGDPNLLPTRP